MNNVKMQDDKAFASFYDVSSLINKKVKDEFEPIALHNEVIFKLKILLFKYRFLTTVLLTRKINTN